MLSPGVVYCGGWWKWGQRRRFLLGMFKMDKTGGVSIVVEPGTTELPSPGPDESSTPSLGAFSAPPLSRFEEDKGGVAAASAPAASAAGASSGSASSSSGGSSGRGGGSRGGSRGGRLRVSPSPEEMNSRALAARADGSVLGTAPGAAAALGLGREGPPAGVCDGPAPAWGGGGGW